MATNTDLVSRLLAAIDAREAIARAATPGPWHVRYLNDSDAMCLVAVSTEPDTGEGERWPGFDHRTMVAGTLIQAPRYLDVEDERWDENAAHIAENDPAAVLRMCDAHRKIVGLCAETRADHVLTLLAQGYGLDAHH